MPTPNPSATRPTIQVGTWNKNTDAFTTVLDLYDNSAWYVMSGGLKMPQPDKAEVRSFNVRTVGELIPKWQYKNRHITVALRVQASSPANVLANLHTYLAAIENPPYVLRLALPGSSVYKYADVVLCKHDIPSDTMEFLANTQRNITIDFECKPTLRRDRVWCQNFVLNPGAEAPGGTPVTVFNDTFANFNAYTTQAGGALAQDKLTYSDAVQSESSLVRYHRLDESSGVNAYDVTGSQIATYVNSPTLGVTGGLTGDTDTAITLAAASSQRVSTPPTGLPTGNSSITVEFLLNIAGAPGSTQTLFSYGNQTITNLQNYNIRINTSRQIIVDVGGSTLITSSAISTAAWHYIALRYDGTTLSLNIDNGAASTATPGVMAIPTSLTNCYLGALQGGIQFASGSFDEWAIYSTKLSDARIAAHQTAQTTTPATTGNTMLIPAAGRQSFGTASWKTFNQWRMRWRYTSGGTYTWYPQYTDANNNLSISTTGTTLTVSQNISAVNTSLGTASYNLVPGTQYWITITIFPGNQIGVTINNDVAGAVGANTIGSVTTTNATTVTLGSAFQIAASGAALGIGGNFTGVHTVGLWGPGGWTFTTSGTVPAWGAWEQDNTKTYPSGPVTSYGAFRIDTPASGTVNATWLAGAATSTTTLARDAMPAYANQTVYERVQVKAPNIGANATIKLQLLEYNSSGTLTATNTLATLTGPQASYVTMTGNYTTANNTTTAYMLLAVQLADTNAGGSANATLWVDNAQMWDSTSTGQTTMSYHELRFPQTPAQYVISGIVGDSLAPILATLSAYSSANWTSTTATFFLGRRTAFNAAARLTTVPNAGIGVTATPVLSTAAYGGYYLSMNTWGAPTASNILNYLPQQNLYPGRVHLMNRMQLSSGTAANVNVYPGMGLTTTQLLAAVQPFSGTGTWGTADAGTMATTFGIPSAYTTSGIQSSQLVMATDTTAKTLFVNSLAAVPDDGETLIYSITNQSSNATVTSTWLMITQEGNTPSTSVFNAGLQNAFLGYTAATYAQIQVNTLGSEIMNLDPTIGSGTNQFVLHALDNSGNPLNNMLEVMYSPMDLYP